MIGAWLGVKILGAARWIWGVLLIVAILVGLFIWQGHRDEANKTIGATAQRETDLRETVDRTEKGNAARETISAQDRAGACARYAQCVRSSRPNAAANCVRFLPEQSTGIGCPGPVTGR